MHMQKHQGPNRVAFRDQKESRTRDFELNVGRKGLIVRLLRSFAVRNNKTKLLDVIA